MMLKCWINSKNNGSEGISVEAARLLPEVLSAGDEAGTLTEEGANCWMRAAIWKLAFRCARRRAMQEPV